MEDILKIVQNISKQNDTQQLQQNILNLTTSVDSNFLATKIPSYVESPILSSLKHRIQKIYKSISQLEGNLQALTTKLEDKPLISTDITLFSLGYISLIGSLSLIIIIIIIIIVMMTFVWKIFIYSADQQTQKFIDSVNQQIQDSINSGYQQIQNSIFLMNQLREETNQLREQQQEELQHLLPNLSDDELRAYMHKNLGLVGIDHDELKMQGFTDKDQHIRLLNTMCIKPEPDMPEVNNVEINEEKVLGEGILVRHILL